MSIIRLLTVSCGALLIAALVPSAAHAQPLGTFRWQLQPFCNVVTLAVTQNGGVYRLEGTDDQCGSGAKQASAIGTAFPNPDGTIGLGLNIVATPGGASVHLDAAITLAALSGTWRDSAGNSGTFAFTPGAGSGGTARPLPAPGVPPAVLLQPDGSVVATRQDVAGPIPASGSGARMMWYAAKVAFRTGQITDGVTAWDDVNVGPLSTAFGLNTTASGLASTALGESTIAAGRGSVAMGHLSRALDNDSIAMGFGTSATEAFSTAIGESTVASGRTSTAMGRNTVASGFGSTAMGDGTTASGSFSLAAGLNTVADGSATVALGSAVSASTGGTFMFGDRSTSIPMSATAANQFFVRAAGGVRFYSNAGLTAGVFLAPGSSAWSVASDVNRKTRFRDLGGDTVLGKLARLSIQEWSYKTQDLSVRHVGPTAQDFHAAFGLGEDPLRISTIDADGIALRAVQALELRDREASATQSAEIEALRARVDDLTLKLADAIAALHEQKAGLKSGPTAPAQKAGLESRPTVRLTAPAKEKQ